MRTGDEVEAALRLAWDRVLERLKWDEPERLRRLARRRRDTMQRPPRAWCIAIRASDHRINKWTALLSPERAADAPEARPRERARKHVHTSEAPRVTERVMSHDVVLDARLVRLLCEPVDLGCGWAVKDAARLLGRSTSNLRYTTLTGRFATWTRPQQGGVPGRAVPVVALGDRVDPNTSAARGHDAAWGEAVWNHGERVPDDLYQTIRRVPVYRPPRSGKHAPRNRNRYLFGGWNWRCPGCGALVRRVYLPLPVVSLPLTTGEDIDESGRVVDALDTSVGAGARRDDRAPLTKADRRRRLRYAHWLALQRGDPLKAYPHNPLGPAPPARLGVETPAVCEGLEPLRPAACFACAACHRVKGFTRVDSIGWNQLVTHLSAGLLYGREVPKPAWWTAERKVVYTPRGATAARHARIEAGLAAGKSPAEIAATEGVAEMTVRYHARVLCRERGVHGIAELRRVLGYMGKAPRKKRARRG